MLYDFGRGAVATGAKAEAAREALKLALFRAGQGDEAAMATVYKQTSGRIYALLLQMLPNKATADEVLQDTYLAVWRKADRFAQGRASPMTWLITIARNKAIDRMRSEHVARSSQPLGELMAEPRDPAPSALARLETDDDRRRLHGCIDQLEARQREAIRAAFFGGVTYDELARRENVPLGTLKSWIRRGLVRLRACLEP
jgi:RNA polymerase sigma factor (sigma-70 family)